MNGIFSRYKAVLFISLIIFGGFFYTQEALAQQPGQRPDFKIIKAAFDGLNLHVEYINATGIGYPARRYEVGFRWYDSSGNQVGVRHYLPVPEVERGGVAILDNKYRIELSYRVGRSVYGRTLARFLEERPASATELRVIVDDDDRIAEEDERNNTAFLKIPLPDLQITGAKFLAHNKLEISYRNANPSPIPVAFRIGFTWAEESGRVLNFTRFMNVLEPASGTTKTEVLSRTEVSYINDQGRQVSDRLDWYLEKRPANATRLKITIDDAGTVREANEQNNLVSVRPDLPDLAISDARLTADALTFTARNIGVGSVPAGQFISFWFEWVNQAGGRVAALVWNDVPAALTPGQFMNFDASRAQFRRERATGGLSDPITFSELMASAPENATHLKVRIDGPNTYAETDEVNNAILVAKPARPLPVLTSDLRIADFTMDPIAPRAGERVFFIVRVDNVGSAATGQSTATGITVDPKNDGTAQKLIGQFTTENIPPGQSKTLRWTKENYYGWVAVEGTHTIEVCADRARVVQERDETNNCARKMVTVGKPLDEPPKLPDLTITKETLDGAALRYLYHNNGEEAAEPGVSFWYEWVDGQGRRIGKLYWINVSGMAGESKREGNQLLDVSTLEGELGKIKLGELIYYPPAGADHLKLTIDGPNAHAESNEQNNSVLLPVLRTDFTITDAEFRNDFPWFKYHNRGNLGHPEEKKVAFWFEWVDAGGVRIGELYWLEVDPPAILSSRSASLARSTSFDSTTTVFSAKGAAKLTEFLNSAPNGATHLKLTIDGPNAHAESNEQNNSVLIDRAKFSSPESQLPKPDLTISRVFILPGRSWLGVEYKNLETAVGTPEFSWTAYWVDGAGQRLGTPYLGIGQALKPWGASGTASDTDVPFGKWLAQPKPAGAVRLEFVIDPDNLIAETNEANNRTTFEGWVPQDTTAQPDLTIVAAELKDDLLFFIYRNDGKGPANNISIWFHFANSVGVQISPLYWLDVEPLAPYRGRQFISKDVVVGSDAGPRPLTEVLRQGPAQSTHLKILIDGPQRIIESNEINNTALVENPVREAEKLPDLALTGGSRSGGVVRFTIVNGTANAISTPLLQFKWLDVKGVTLQTSPVSYWQHETIAAGKTGDFTLEYERWREDGVIYFLKHPPAGTVALLATIDPENKVKEAHEDNNSFRIALGQPDLAYGTPVVRSGALIIPIINHGAAASVATDMWLQWYGGGKWLPSTGAVDVPAVAPGATAEISVPLDRSFGADGKILADIPPTAERLRLFLDGLRKVDELSEQNNTIMLERSVFPKITETTPLPDLAFNAVHMAGKDIGKEFFVVSIKNAGLKPTGEFVWQMRWIDRAGKAVGETYRNIYSGLNPNWNIGMTTDAQDKTGKPMTMGEFVSLPPEGAVLLEALLDPDNRITELNEQNNRAIIAALALESLKKERPKPKPEGIEEKPDLTVDGAGFLPLVDIIEKDRAPFEAVFSAIVSNKGKQESGSFRARVRVDNGGNGTWEAVSPSLVSVPTLAVGEQTLIKLPLEWKAAVGTYTFEICVDPGKNIDESNESNNCATDRFTLKVGEEPAQEEEMIE